MIDPRIPFDRMTTAGIGLISKKGISMEGGDCVGTPFSGFISIVELTAMIYRSQRRMKVYKPNDYLKAFISVISVSSVVK
jgi:hypothetical protein